MIKLRIGKIGTSLGVISVLFGAILA
jgi:hypothetical protein